MQVFNEVFFSKLLHAVLHSLNEEWIKLIFNIIAHDMAHHCYRYIMFKNNSERVLFLMILDIFIATKIVSCLFICRIIRVLHLLSDRPRCVGQRHWRDSRQVFCRIRLEIGIQEVLVIADQFRRVSLELVVLNYRLSSVDD